MTSTFSAGRRRRPAGRPRVGFVCQPATTLLPARDSVTMVTKELAVRVGEHADVVLYGSGGSRRTSTVDVDGLLHVLVPTGPDLALHRLAGAVRRRLGGDEPRRPFFESRLSYLAYACRVGLQLRRRRCDIVHIQSFSHFVPVIRALNPRAKVVLHMHCEWLSQLDPSMIGSRLGQADLVVSCSDHVTDRVEAAFPGRVRCVTVHNGVVTPAAGGRPPAGPPVTAGPRKRLLFVSRVSPEKGLHVLLDAFRLIVDRYPEVVLDIVGPEHTIPSGYIVDVARDPEVAGLRAFYDGDSYGDHLRRRIPEVLADRVSFLGFVPPGDLAGLYRSATMLVHPTLSDSFGMPVAEAMAAGLPVVASRVGGVPELVEDGRTGLLVPANDPEALAAAVVELLTDEPRAARMGRLGRERALERFTWDRAATTLWSEYERLLGRPERPAA